MDHAEKYLSVLGRVLLCAIFLASAAGKITDFSGTQAYMASAGMPATAILLIAAIVFEVGGSLSVLLGYKARAGASLLIVFLIPATLIFHAFWKAGLDPATAKMQTVNFLKNVAIMGGLLQVVAFGPGAISLDAKAYKIHPSTIPDY